MKDLIRSPLQFIQPMTEDELRELMLRAVERERLRDKRRERRAKAQPVDPANARRRLPLTRSVSSVSL